MLILSCNVDNNARYNSPYLSTSHRSYWLRLASYSLNARQVLPTFYLNYNVLYTGGAGTSSSPFRIK